MNFTSIFIMREGAFLAVRLSEHISLSIYYIRVSQERTVGELERRARIHEEHCRREAIERVRGRGKLQPLDQIWKLVGMGPSTLRTA